MLSIDDEALIIEHHWRNALDRQAIELVQVGKWRRHHETPEQTIGRLRASIVERIGTLQTIRIAGLLKF